MALLAALAVRAAHCALLGAGRAGLARVARSAAHVAAEQAPAAALAAGGVAQLLTARQRADGLEAAAAPHQQGVPVRHQLHRLLAQRLAQLELLLHGAGKALAASGAAQVATGQLALARGRALPWRRLHGEHRPT